MADDFDYTDSLNRVQVYRRKKGDPDWVDVSYVETKRNDLGQVTSEKQKHGTGLTMTLDYSYYQGGGKAGQLKYVYYPSGGGNRIQWQYDSRGRPTNLWRRVGGVELKVGAWSWNADSSVSWFRRGNNVDTWHGYDSVGRVSQKKTWRGAAVEFNTFFEYDAVGNRITQRIMEEYAWDELYDYDTLYRLKDMKRGQLIQQGETWMVLNLQRQEDWGLDMVGNWDSYHVFTPAEDVFEYRTHDVLNELVEIQVGPETTDLTYDLQGNLTDDGEKLYEWDVTGRLERVKDKATTDLIASFEYDSYGRRIVKNCFAGSFHYYYDGWRVVEESMSGSWTARNVWGLYLDELVVRTDVYSGGDELYPVSNPIYSPLRYYDENGDLVVRAKYTPYGKPTLLDSQDQQITPNEFNLPILFTGQRYDVGTGMCYYKMRYHCPAEGRLLGRDPLLRRRSGPTIGERCNHYEYVSSRPIDLVDPSGLLQWDIRHFTGWSGMEEFGEAREEQQITYEFYWGVSTPKYPMGEKRAGTTCVPEKTTEEDDCTQDGGTGPGCGPWTCQMKAYEWTIHLWMVFQPGWHKKEWVTEHESLHGSIYAFGADRIYRPLEPAVKKIKAGGCTRELAKGRLFQQAQLWEGEAKSMFWKVRDLSASIDDASDEEKAFEKGVKDIHKNYGSVTYGPPTVQCVK